MQSSRAIGSSTPRSQASMKTQKIFHANTPRKYMIDYAVERAAGQPMTAEERDAELAKVSENLCARAMESHKKARKAR